MTTAKDIARSGSISIPPDNRRAYIKRLNLDGTYDTNWYEITGYVTKFPQIKQGFPDDVFIGEYTDEDVSIVVDNSDKAFNDVDDFDSLFYGYRTRYKTLFKFELYAVDEAEADVLLKAWYGISFSNPSMNDESDMEFSISSTVKILNNYSADGIDLSSGTTEQLVTRLLNKEQNGVKIFEQYFAGFSINPDIDICMTISSPYIKSGATVLDKLRDYSFYNDFFYYVDNDGYLVWTNREATATTQYELNGAGQTDSVYPTNIISINSFYNDIDNVYTKVVIDYKENSILDREFFEGLRKDNGDATYLSSANSNTIYDWLKNNSYMGTDSKLNQLYVSSRTALDTYLASTFADYDVNIIEKLDGTVKKESKSATKDISWSVGDGSLTDIYGEKIFNIACDELVTSEAESVAQRILDAYKNIVDVIELNTFGTFQLQPKDKVEVNYQGEVNVTNPFIIGVSLLGGADVLAGRTGSINISGLLAKISSILVDFDNFDILIKVRSF